MKKILTLAALLGAASISFGQGNVNFANGVATTTHISINATHNGPSVAQTPAVPNSYYYELFVAASTVTTAPTSLNPVADGFTAIALGTNTGIGRLSGNPDSNDTIVPGFGVGSTASFVIVGWSANLGTTWNQASANNAANTTSDGIPFYIGESAVATGVILGGGPTPAGTIFGGNTGNIPGFTLNFTPVP